jgi:hypothetical protein
MRYDTIRLLKDLPLAGGSFIRAGAVIEMARRDRAPLVGWSVRFSASGVLRRLVDGRDAELVEAGFEQQP